MSSFNLSFSDLFAKYKDWICKNPQTASEIESTVKWLSYFVAGKINKSVVFSELIYSASNLLILFNDLIIRSSYHKLESHGDKIKIFLSVLEYSEVFLEISAKSAWGEKAKWVFILCIQIFKCIGKLLLLFQYKERIISCPAILPHSRNSNEVDNELSDNRKKTNNSAFSLKRSGRIVRKVDSAPSTSNRLWKPPSFIQKVNHSDEKPDKLVVQQQLVGEILYILKPLVNLGTVLKCGQSTWKPWIISAVMDLTSIYLLLSKPKRCNSGYYQLTDAEKMEMTRRRLIVLLYLMRSPFYEKYTKEKINNLLTKISKTIPLAKIICNPIQQYLPYWQETYFYLWST